MAGLIAQGPLIVLALKNFDQQSAISNADERMQALVPLYPYHATNYKY